MIVATPALDAQTFFGGYVRRLTELLGALDLPALERAAGVLERAWRERRGIFVAGNGGSAATASHMAADLSWAPRLTDASRPRVIGLCDNAAMLTAVGNDQGYDDVFVEQLRGLWSAGDVLVAISASGNSPNVVRAAEFARANGGEVVGLTGFDGGALHRLSTAPVHVPTRAGEYGPVEDVHLVLNHLLVGYLVERLAGTATASATPLAGAE